MLKYWYLWNSSLGSSPKMALGGLTGQPPTAAAGPFQCCAVRSSCNRSKQQQAGVQPLIVLCHCILCIIGWCIRSALATHTLGGCRTCSACSPAGPALSCIYCTIHAMHVAHAVTALWRRTACIVQWVSSCYQNDCGSYTPHYFRSRGARGRWR
jgi:hypothetical protein